MKQMGQNKTINGSNWGVCDLGVAELVEVEVEPKVPPCPPSHHELSV